MSQLFIGVDVGYGNTKTANTVFSSGVRKHSTKPPINSMVVETNGGFYSVNHAKTPWAGAPAPSRPGRRP